MPPIPMSLLGRAVALICVCLWTTPLSAASLPAGFSESVLASGLSSPTAMQFAPDGRLVRVPAGRALRVIKNGVLLATPFVSLTRERRRRAGPARRGLRSRTSPPTGTSTSTTRPTPRRCTTASAASPPTATSPCAGSEVVLAGSRRPVGRHQPQRRGHRLRPRRQALRRRRRERQRRERAVAVHPARQDAAPQRRRHRSRPTTRFFRDRRHAVGRQPRHLGGGPAQSVHLRLQPRRPGADDAINDVGPEHLGGDQRRRRRRQLRLAALEGAGARPGATSNPRYAYDHRRRRLRDHRRRVLRAGDDAASRPSTRTTTSSPTSAPAGSAASTPRTKPSPASPPASARRSTSRSATTAASTTSRAARARSTASLRQPAAGHHRAAGQPHRGARQARDVPVVGQRRGAVHVSVAAQRQQHRAAPPAPATPSRRRSSPTTARASASGSPTAAAACSATRRC